MYFINQLKAFSWLTSDCSGLETDLDMIGGYMEVLAVRGLSL